MFKLSSALGFDASDGHAAFSTDAAPHLASRETPAPPASGPALRDEARISHVRVTAPAMSVLTDRELVDRTRQGDRAAFAVFVRRHQRRILRLAIHMLRDRSEAEDVTQETFVRAYRAIDRFDGRSEPYTWLYRIAVNLSLNALRARRTSRLSAPVHDNDPRVEAFSIARGAVDGPSARLADREIYAALCESIDALSESLRTTLILVCVDGRSHEDASQILGAPEGTIAWRVHEARRKLREAMATRGFDLDDDDAFGGSR